MAQNDFKLAVLFFENDHSNMVTQKSYLNWFKLYLKILLNKKFCFVSEPCLLKWMGVTVQSTNFILLLNDQIYWKDESHFLGKIAKIQIKYLSSAFMGFLAGFLQELLLVFLRMLHISVCGRYLFRHWYFWLIAVVKKLFSLFRKINKVVRSLSLRPSVRKFKIIVTFNFAFTFNFYLHNFCCRDSGKSPST